jgi:hypothetical protein
VTGLALAQVDAAVGARRDAGVRFGSSAIGHELASVIAGGPAPPIAVVMLPNRFGWPGAHEHLNRNRAWFRV